MEILKIKKKKPCSKNEGEKDNIEKAPMKQNYHHTQKYIWED